MMFCRSVDSSSSSTTATPVASSHNGSWDEVGVSKIVCAMFTLLLHCLINKCYPKVFKYLPPYEANKNIFNLFLPTSPSLKSTLHSGFAIQGLEVTGFLLN